MTPNRFSQDLLMPISVSFASVLTSLPLKRFAHIQPCLVGFGAKERLLSCSAFSPFSQVDLICLRSLDMLWSQRTYSMSSASDSCSAGCSTNVHRFSEPGVQASSDVLNYSLFFFFLQGANRMRGRLGSVDSFERCNSLASDKVRKELSSNGHTVMHGW